MNFEENLKKYAKLIVEIGVNIQKDQELMIRCPIEGAPFARELTQYAYEAGAKRVYIEYNDEELTRMTYSYASNETLSEYPSWIANGYNELAERGAAFISISAGNPDILKDVSPDKIAVFQKAAGKALETYKRYISNSDVTWCVVSIPTLDWSKKLFPHVDAEEGVRLLWEKIFEVTRIYEEDPVRAWQEHTEALAIKCEVLNNKKIQRLKYNAPGTDLTVELPKDHIWLGGGEYSTKGTYFVANMPTEEIFTMPYKYGVEGMLTSTKPLNYGGNLIEDFTLHFKKGKIVKCTAKKGEEMLKKLIETDEGACYLGEVAIVPHSSPVSASQTIFFNTLFDENASCHFAIGSSYPINIKDGATMDKETLESKGANTSIIHQDFMVGCKEMTIEATTESAETFYLIKDGEWAF
ncbi:aminopeptidase [Cellulosilyticum sp. I15G10I2]|uniref:aminopeptidase n=1 Tax=Cellulosilyticum sp. I15G10I2 TaxID=1892843 RepID=UPI00085C53DF|nr:aminopeptidase [Cellulosilyticum sp. I15G10I2]